MGSGLFKNINVFTNHFLINMYKEDLALNNLQWLICHKTQPNPPLVNPLLDSSRLYPSVIKIKKNQMSTCVIIWYCIDLTVFSLVTWLGGRGATDVTFCQE